MRYSLASNYSKVGSRFLSLIVNISNEAELLNSSLFFATKRSLMLSKLFSFHFGIELLVMLSASY